MFIHRLNMGLLLRTRIEKTVHDTDKDNVLGAAVMLSDIWDMIFNSLEKGAIANNASYCQLLTPNLLYLLNDYEDVTNNKDLFIVSFNLQRQNRSALFICDEEFHFFRWQCLFLQSISQCIPANCYTCSNSFLMVVGKRMQSVTLESLCTQCISISNSNIKDSAFCAGTRIILLMAAYTNKMRNRAKDLCSKKVNIVTREPINK